jgi:hypothetical protein
VAQKVKPGVQAADKLRRRLGEFRQLQEVEVQVAGQREVVRRFQQAKAQVVRRHLLLASPFLMVLWSPWVAVRALRTVYQPHATRANAEKIKKGMSPREVNAILGEPYSVGRGVASDHQMGAILCYWEPSYSPPWEWEHVVFAVIFSESGNPDHSALHV